MAHSKLLADIADMQLLTPDDANPPLAHYDSCAGYCVLMLQQLRRRRGMHLVCDHCAAMLALVAWQHSPVPGAWRPGVKAPAR